MGLFDDTISPWTSGSGYSGAVAPDYTAPVDVGYSGTYDGPNTDSIMFQPETQPDLGATSAPLDTSSWSTDFMEGTGLGFAWTGDTSDPAAMSFKDALTTSFVDSAKFNPLENTSPLGEIKNETEESSIGKMITDNPVTRAYGAMDAEGKKFVWSAALGLFGQLMTSDARKDQRKAANKTADAIAKNADTNRMTYELAASKQNNAMTSAGEAWKTVPKVSSQYAPPTMLNVTTRWSPQ